jgi:hypothetical protein
MSPLDVAICNRESEMLGKTSEVNVGTDIKIIIIVA